MDFSELGMVKIEANNPIPGLDQLSVTLEMGRFTDFDILASAEEGYMEEIDLATYIQSMLMVRALEPRGAPLLEPANEPSAATEP